MLIHQDDLWSYINMKELNRREIAEKLGISKAFLCYVENGHKRFGTTVQKAFKKHYGVEIQWAVPYRRQPQDKKA